MSGTDKVSINLDALPGNRYHVLRTAPGEPHVTREDLGAAPEDDFAAALPILRFVHLTDFQLADPASPGRLDFVQRFSDRPDWAGMFPAYRPQEVVALHGFEAMIRTVAAVAADDPIRFVLTTGDNTDNAQANELTTFLSIMDGEGRIDPLFGVDDPKAIPAHAVSGDYYNPESESHDRYKREYGFPDHPGVLTAAAKPFEPNGFGVPWLACFGNHDCLAQGRTPVTEAFQRLVTGDQRPVAAPERLPSTAPMAAYLADPTVLSGGPAITIEPHTDRRLVAKSEYVRAHLDSPAEPTGHGFTAANLAEDTAYYCYDEIPGVRLIVLDTTNPGGDVTGSIGRRQYDWLADRLTEVHSSHLNEDGGEIVTGNPDRVVIIASHHALSMMDNATERPDEARQPDADLPRFLAAGIEALLHRFGNVALWLAGHEHRNSVVAHPGRSGGFWMVISSGLCEWPCQSRLLDLRLADGDRLVIRSTMIDHAAPARPTGDQDLWDLASVHRELAANEPIRVGGPESAGAPADRNVDLVVPISAALAGELRRWPTRR